MIRIWINNEWQEFKELKGVPYKTAIDDSLDTATAIFYADFKEPIAKNTYVEIYGEIIMIVYNDQSIPISKYKNKWQHTLSLIEPTHLLDQIPCNNICLTNKRQSFYSKFKQMTKNIYFYSTNHKYFDLEKEEFEDISIVRIVSSELIRRMIDEVSKPDIYCLNMTAKECYNELLKTINARIELYVYYEEYKNTFSYILDYRSGDKRNKLVSFNEMTSLYTYDSNNMTNNISYNAKNAVTRYPMTQGYEGFKTTEATLTTENATIILNHEIEDIVSFKVKAQGQAIIHVELDSDTERIVRRDLEIEFDLSNYLIEQEAYDLLTSVEQQWLIPYTKNNIIPVGKLGILNTILKGTGSKIEAIVKDGIKEKLSDLEFIKEKMKNDNEYPSTIYDVNFSEADTSLSKYKIHQIAYQMIYYPILNVSGKITKDISKNNILSVYDNQQEEVLSLERYSDYLENKLNRIGNTEIEIDEINQELKGLNSYTEDGYVIYEREVSSALNEVKAHYKLSKDYNMLNSRLAVDQKKRLYEIPKDYQDCYLMPKYMMSVSTKTIEEAGDTKREKLNFFTTEIVQSCIKTLLGVKRDEHEIRGIWFEPYAQSYSDGNSLEPKYLYCSTYAFQKSLHFFALTYDNYSTALSVGGQVLGGKKAIYNPYVDEEGEFEYVNFALCQKQNDFFAPLEKLLEYPKESVAGEKVTHKIKLNYSKDRVQRICFDICVDIQSIDEDVYIGKEFYQNNAILQNTEIPLLYLWYSQEEKYDKRPIIAKGRKVNQDINNLFEVTDYADLYNSYNRFNYIGEPIENVKSWAIADNFGNIYLAVNGAIRPIYFI